jgi:hypothetical protein
LYGIPGELVFDRGLLFDEAGRVWRRDARRRALGFDAGVHIYYDPDATPGGSVYKLVGVVESRIFARMKALREPAARSPLTGSTWAGIPHLLGYPVLMYGVGDAGKEPVLLELVGGYTQRRVGPEAEELQRLLYECAKAVGDAGL